MAEDKENKTERVQLLMTPSELEAIDEWGFSNRIRTRAEVIRRLCQMALAYSAEGEAIKTSADALVDMMLADDGIDDVEAGRMTVQNWISAHFDKEAEITESAIELASDIGRLDIVRRYYADGDKNPSLDKAAMLRAKLKEERERKGRVIRSESE